VEKKKGAGKVVEGRRIVTEGMRRARGLLQPFKDRA